MIINSYVYQVYSMLIHGPDIMMPDATPFCSLFRYGQAVPASCWTEDEQKIAAWAIAQAIAHPRPITAPPVSEVLPNPPRTGYGRCGTCHQPYEGDACPRCFPI